MYQTGYVNTAPLSYGIPFMGGICQWWYAPKEHIATWPGIDPLTQFLLTEPTLAAEKVWFGPMQVPDDTLGYEEPLQRNAAGFYYKQKVLGFYPGDDAFSRTNLMNKPWHQYVIVAKMRAGGFFLVLGTPEQGMQFDADYASGPGGISTAGAKFAFSLNAIEKGQVLLFFSEAPSLAPPGYEVPGDPSGGSGGNDVEIIEFTTEESVTIPWVDERIARFGIFPLIEVWKYIAGIPTLIAVSITTDAGPPDQSFFTVFTPGTPGFIVIK